jgi:exonuclease V gamma subunit
MSTLYLGTDPAALADRLAQLLDETSRTTDIFKPATVVVPHRFLRRWLQMFLARKLGVAIHVRFVYLENALWNMLRSVDRRPFSSAPEVLDHDHYRLMVLAALREANSDPNLAPFTAYLYRHSGSPGRDYWRRLWRLSDRLASLIRDYEYHRQDMLVQKWLNDKLGLEHAGEIVPRQERGQRAIFQRITREGTGLRALLERATGKVLKTLPQYAMEVIEANPPPAELRDRVCIFGLSQISQLHVRTLHWLDRYYDLNVYYLNPLVARLDGTSGTWHERFQGIARDFSQASPLLSAWGRAGAESLYLMAGLLEDPNPFVVDVVHRAKDDDRKKRPGTVLHAVQSHLLDHGPDGRLGRDLTLQVAGCPSIYREVETVYNNILHNLQSTPDLKQTDIAVLATDLDSYRPVIQAVFERDKRLHYSLAHFSAAGQSNFGHALLGFLDLALESFTRSRVFAVLFNPCFLARHSVDRSEAAKWLDWAESLGIYHGWNQADKRERGYLDTPQFAWQLGLRRLRLGRLMDTAGMGDGHAPCFRQVVPYADLESSDKERLDAFCRAVEGLLPVLIRLRSHQATGRQWAGEIRRLANQFLAVPEDQPGEDQVRDRVLQSVDQLALLDNLFGEAQRKFPLPLVREFVANNLEAFEGSRGEILTGGVTVASLASVRYVPFRIVYVLGLNESKFPGSNALPSFDLRAAVRSHGDIRPAENNRFLFLEILLSACDKIYLLYTNKDLQKDHELHPAVPLIQLKRFVGERVMGSTLAEVQVPTQATDLTYLKRHEETDLLVNYDLTDRVVMVQAAERAGMIALDERQKKTLQKHLSAQSPNFDLPQGNAANKDEETVVSVRELKKFLEYPAEATLRRHLRLSDEDEPDTEDDEPFSIDRLDRHILMVPTVERIVDRAMTVGVEASLREWQPWFREYFEVRRLCSSVPDGAFGDVARTVLVDDIDRWLNGEAALKQFLERRPRETFVGTILIGESRTPVHANLHFPALELELGEHMFLPARARLVGSCRSIWRSEKAIDVLVPTSCKEVSECQLSTYIFAPLLFFMALRLGREKIHEGVSSAEWLGGRALRIYILHGAGMAKVAYQPRDLPPNKVARYMKRLVMDLLNPGSFENLPFSLLMDRTSKLVKAFQANDIISPAHYRAEWRDALKAWKGNERGIQMSSLMKLVNPEVPHDALDRICRRFRFLDAPLRRVRKRQKRA